jgi:large subunit ribosomal protein L10
MAITKQKKVEIVDKMRGIMSSAKTLVFVNFHGLTVAEERELRSSLRKEGVGYTVAKKSLIKRALDEKGITGNLPELSGEVAVAYGADELSPAREVAAFAKTHAEHIAMLGGVFGGEYMDKAAITGIASIPGLETLRAQFVQLINSPLSRFAIVLNAKADKGE